MSRFVVEATESLHQTNTHIIVKCEGDVVAEIEVYSGGAIYVDKADVVSILKTKIHSTHHKVVNHKTWFDVEFKPDVSP